MWRPYDEDETEGLRFPNPESAYKETDVCYLYYLEGERLKIFRGASVVADLPFDEVAVMQRERWERIQED